MITLLCEHLVSSLFLISIVVNNSYVVLTCQASSSLVPVEHDLRMIYRWQRNGQEAETCGRFHASGQSLAVTDVKKEDLGNYSCQTTEEGLASNWSDTVDLQILARPEVGELTVNGTESTTAKENQVVVFRCMVVDYLSPAASLIQENSLAAVNMSRKQQNVYEHVMVVRKCSQLGVYFCRASNVAGSSEDGQHKVVLKGMPHEQASHVFVTNGETLSIVINMTLCSYPGLSNPKWRFTQSGKLQDITDMKKYQPATKNMRHNVFEYSLVINNATDADFGVYIFSVEYNHSSADFIIAASRMTATPETSLPLVAGSSVSVVIVTLAIIAGVILSRLNQLRDYWNLRFRSYITPMQNMPENVDDREYAEIDDACIPERGEGNIVQPVVNVPPACADRQQLEGEDDEYEEVGPLHATNREERPTQPERRATMQQPDKEIQEAINEEITVTLPDSQPHLERRIVAADWSAEGGVCGKYTAALINQSGETSFMTQEPNEIVTDKVSVASGKYSGANGMTEANHRLVDGREDFAETLELSCNRYESLMSPQPQPTYTALNNDDDITHD
ncbi:uncharacterized protein [Haliotis asinina]|uniref:uncharacterized protein n=1 Tax=Haliotis asinina TaxID=109174 RepID=UPI0035319B98